MSGYSSVASAESLPVATPKAEMVEVESPGTLSAGYTFQATYNGVIFPVTVVGAAPHLRGGIVVELASF